MNETTEKLEPNGAINVMNKKYQADMNIIFELLYEGRDLISRGLRNIRQAFRLFTDLMESIRHDDRPPGTPPYPQEYFPPQKKDEEL